jgi:CDP-diacylglycerol--glycerol-3-phosphate 3-phosphatidyltransferase
MTMGIYSLKPRFVRSLRSIEDILVDSRVSPDALSAWAVVVSAVAGALLTFGAFLDEPLIWLGVAPLSVARLALNALDGSVARRTGTARPFGAVINEMCDRLADWALLVPMASFVSPTLVFTAVVAALCVSFSGVLAQALIGTRATGGPMGKADRIAVVAVASVIGAITSSPIPLEIALGVVIAGSLVTVFLRLSSIRAGLRDRGENVAAG